MVCEQSREQAAQQRRCGALQDPGWKSWAGLSGLSALEERRPAGVRAMGEGAGQLSQNVGGAGTG